MNETIEAFIDEKVVFAGFTENLVGLMVASGDATSTAANRMMKQRFTITPEINIDFAEKFRVFASWRFVKEIRYGKEAIDRGNATPALPPDDNTFYDETSPVPREFVMVSPPRIARPCGGDGSSSVGEKRTV